MCSTLNYLRESGERKDYSRCGQPSLSLLFVTFTFIYHFHFLFVSLFTFREELQEFWNPGQCSAKQYEGLEDSAYEDDDDDEEFYEDIEEFVVEDIEEFVEEFGVL